MRKRTQQSPDFHRLAAGLRCMIIDYDYAKTRKLLDPKWNGYNIPKGHDIIADDVDLKDANLVTSRLKDFDLHRVVLDLDYGASYLPASYLPHRVVNDLRLTMQSPPFNHASLFNVLRDCNIPQRMPPTIHNTTLDLYTNHDLALIPSTTPGHHHLILDVNLSWLKYITLLDTLSVYGIIQPGYCKASIARGFSAIRPPWIKKETS